MSGEDFNPSPHACQCVCVALPVARRRCPACAGSLRLAPHSPYRAAPAPLAGIALPVWLGPAQGHAVKPYILRISRQCAQAAGRAGCPRHTLIATRGRE